MRASIMVLLCASACSAATTPTAGAQPEKTATKSAIPARLNLARGVVVVQTATAPLRFRVELALTGPERERGLMYREVLADDEGMLFLFEKQEPRSFWMKNTYLPLDMVFIDEDLVVQGIVENAEPLTTSSRHIEKPTRHVLELNGGAARRLSIGVGNTVALEGVAPELWQKTNTATPVTTSTTKVTP